MKKLLTLFAITLAVMVSSCGMFDDTAIWNKLNEQEETLKDHEKRITALEELCRQLNTNIDALQTIVEALEKNDYVTNVSPIREDGEIVGYTISFANSDTITIYNGKDGVDGKDGYTPQIGVMKDTDGIYYWTVDGEWLLDGKGNKIKAIGEDGRDGQDGNNGSNGNDGQDGNNGQDGADGKDGITPRLKIENDYWYVSYDEGATWIELGKATGEDGADGSDSDSIFSSVTQDDEYVYFNLADGTMITLPKHDKENIQFEDLQVKAICCKNWDTNDDGELSYAEAAAVTDIGLAFRGNSNIIAFTELEYFISLTTINADAFNGCTSLWKITIPDSVTSIGYAAFDRCSSLTSINIPDGVTSIGDAVFNRCSSLKEFKGKFASVDGRCLVVDEKLIYFAQYGLTEYTIPDGVTSIGYNAFAYCSGLTSITIPDNVTSIGNAIFNRCSSLKEFKGKFASVDGRCLVVDEKLISFAQCGLTEYTIPDGVTSIGDGAFCYCYSLTSVTIPDSVTSIGIGAFSGCNSLTSVTIGNGVTEIGFQAFWGCYSLTSVTIGNGVTEIGGCAFEECTSLKEVYCKPTTPPKGGSWMFYNNASGRKIYVPTESVEAYKAADAWNAYADDIYGYDFENNSI